MESLARKLPTVARILLGLIFFVFGLNGFLNFLPPPPPDAMSPAGGAFAGALAATGYMFPMIKGVEVVAGLLLLTGRFVPLSLVLLAPIVVNIAAMHILLERSGFVMTGVVVGLELYLAWAYRATFAPLFVAKAEPSVGRPQEAQVQVPTRTAAAE